MSPEVKVAEERKSVWKRKIIIPEESMSYIQIGEEMMVIRDIHKNFSKTETGQKLNENIRWSMYEDLGLKKGEWQKILGYDVNNLEHGQLTYGITYLFLTEMKKSNYFSLEEKRLLLLTAIVHDWGEGMTKAGDVNYNRKTKDDEKRELEALVGGLKDIVGEKTANQVKEILEDTTTKLGQFFNLIEYTGYLATGIKAWEKSKEVSNLKLAENLVWLNNNVLSNTIPKLIKYSEIYPPIKSFLESRKNIISEGFREMPANIFDKYQPAEREKFLTKFQNSKEAWGNFI